MSNGAQLDNPALDFTHLDLNGNGVRLSNFLHKKPLLLVSYRDFQ